MRIINIRGWVACAFLCLGSLACDKEPSCPADFNLDLALDDADTGWINALVDYYFEASDQNCKRLKSAIENYLQEAEAIRDCARKTSKEDELNELVEEAQADLANLPC